jgi:outer membrane protein assembly factor BamA
MALVAAVALTLDAQTSRWDEIEAERDQKSQQLAPEAPDGLERRLNWLKEARMLEHFSEGRGGLRLKVGGMVNGAGFAIGPEYSRQGLLGGRMNFRAAAQSSARGYQKLDTEITVPRFVRDRITLDIYAVRHNYPGLNYYGPGPASQRSGRSGFRLEDAAFDLTATVRATGRLALGGSAGYLINNIGPGTDNRFISSDQIYRVPGMDLQANFTRLSAFAQYDTRDYTRGPRSGGNYFVQIHQFGDRTLGLHDFERLDMEAQRYVPFFNRRRVLALRARSVMTFQQDGRTIPFYMQPTLGGQDDLRGYRPFRFRDNNLLLMNAEYRWEVFSGMDMALFADAGKVAARKADLDLHHLESSFGFGFRFNARNHVFLRLDIGFSHEGFQVVVKFNNLFRKGPTRTSSTMEDF